MVEFLTAAILSLAGASGMTEERAGRLAQEVVEVVRDERALFAGSNAIERTALMVVAVAFVESRFDEAVERCEVSKLGHQDYGKSIGLMQLFSGPNWEGLDRDAICASSKTQFRLGLRTLLRSRGQCGKEAPEVWLGAYNSGSCMVTQTASRAWGTYRTLATRSGWGV